MNQLPIPSNPTNANANERTPLSIKTLCDIPKVSEGASNINYPLPTSQYNRMLCCFSFTTLPANSHSIPVHSFSKQKPQPKSPARNFTHAMKIKSKYD